MIVNNMMPIVVLVASLAMCLGAPEGFRTSEGDYVKYEPNFGGRIVGGEVANIADLPYQVAILQDLLLVCGGSLVAPKTVLTTASCVAPSVISNITQLAIRAGSAKGDDGGSVIQVSSRTIHDLFNNCIYCTPRYDIGVVFLAFSAIGAGGVASVIPLADNLFADGTYGVVSGWGATTEGGPNTDELRRVDVPVFNHAQCHSIYGNAIDEQTVCAGYENGGKDACQGDAGDPYAVNGQLLGIVSWGVGCARGEYPGVYVSIPGFRDWIRNNAGV